jgi:twitching motility protein PilT
VNNALSEILARHSNGGQTAQRNAGRVPLPAICATVLNAVPHTAQGRDRIRFIGEQALSLLDRDRTLIREQAEELMKYMLKIGASDLDMGGFSCNGFVWYRVNGEKEPYPDLGEFTPDEVNFFTLCLLNESQIEVLLEELSLDFSWQLPVVDGKRRRFRATLYFDQEHLALNMRAITDEVRQLSGMEFHPLIERGMMFNYVRDGLTLITGVTGSGKSTTMDAIIDANNKSFGGHIVIVGKPIEYVHYTKRCIVRHREVGRDVKTFKAGIVQSLRQDPDIVVIGEMRDPETISAALEITDSGHKVFSTLHTCSAVESIDRIIAEYPSEAQERVRNRLADVLRCVVSQKLCPKVGGGRVLAKEVLWMTPSARAAIKNNNSGEIYQMMWEGTAQGQITLEQDLCRLARLGKITPETAFSYANNKRRLQQLLS